MFSGAADKSLAVGVNGFSSGSSPSELPPLEGKTSAVAGKSLQDLHEAHQANLVVNNRLSGGVVNNETIATVANRHLQPQIAAKASNPWDLLRPSHTKPLQHLNIEPKDISQKNVVTGKNRILPIKAKVGDYHELLKKMEEAVKLKTSHIKVMQFPVKSGEQHNLHTMTVIHDSKDKKLFCSEKAEDVVGWLRQSADEEHRELANNIGKGIVEVIAFKEDEWNTLSAFAMEYLPIQMSDKEQSEPQQEVAILRREGSFKQGTIQIAEKESKENKDVSLQAWQVDRSASSSSGVLLPESSDARERERLENSKKADEKVDKARQRSRENFEKKQEVKKEDWERFDRQEGVENKTSRLLEGDR